MVARHEAFTRRVHEHEVDNGRPNQSRAKGHFHGVGKGHSCELGMSVQKGISSRKELWSNSITIRSDVIKQSIESS